MSEVTEVVDVGVLLDTTLGAEAEYVTSGSRDWSKYYADAGAIFIRTQDINRNRLSLDSVAFVQLPARVEGKRSLVRKSDLLITITGANVGKVAVVDFDIPEAYVSQSVCLVRLKNPAIAKFVQLQLVASRGEKTALEAMAYGLGRPVLNLENIRSARIKIGPERVQGEIVAEIEKQFSRLDEAVANLQRVKANLKRYKASVLKDAVEGRLVPTEAELARREGRRFETGEHLLQRILEVRRSQWVGKSKYKEPNAPDQADASELPAGWVWATMGQLGEVQLGRMLDKQKHTSGEPYRYLRNINVRWGAFDLSDLFEMNFESNQLDRFGVCDGDVFVCEGGEPARAAVWRMGKTDIKYQKALHRVRFDGAFVPELLMFVLEHLAKSGVLEELYGGSTIKHFTREVFVTLRVPVPPIAEQHRIVAEVERRLSLVRSVEAEVDANLKRAGALRHSVLCNSFVGP